MIITGIRQEIERIACELKNKMEAALYRVKETTRNGFIIVTEK